MSFLIGITPRSRRAFTRRKRRQAEERQVQIAHSLHEHTMLKKDMVDTRHHQLRCDRLENQRERDMEMAQRQLRENDKRVLAPFADKDVPAEALIDLFDDHEELEGVEVDDGDDLGETSLGAMPTSRR